MKKRIPIDPFAYTKLDVATTLVQIATAVAGIVLAANGNAAGLLALGALAGGGKGTLIGDLFRKVSEELGEPADPKRRRGFIRFPLMVIIVVAVLLLTGCGIDKQFIIDSQKAIRTQVGDYLTGCEQATIAPAFSVDWNENVTYGGGIFAGCEANGKLLRFHCDAYRDDETGKTGMTCEPLSVWELRENE